MKKLFYSLFALAAMAMTNTSCSDELENATSNSNEVPVTFKVQLENAVGSRAVGDGTTATELQYAVYKVGGEGIGNLIEALAGETTVKRDLTAEVTFTLVKGETYNFMFWAQKPGVSNTDKNVGNEYYTLDKEAGKVTINYKGNANDEGRDAFFKVRKDLKVTGPINETIVLKRPFAQINVGTSIGSLADAKKAETDFTRSSFTIKKVSTELDMYTGAASEETAKVVEASFAIADIIESNKEDKVGDLKNVNGTDYEYLAMNYILVPDAVDNTADDDYGVGEDKVLVDTEFKMYAGTSKDPVHTFTIPNVPVQRNWRTNIIGDILNENVTFNVIIDPKFDDDHVYDISKELEYAALNGGTVTLDKDVTLETPLVVKANMVLDLRTHTLTGGKPYVANTGLTGQDISVITVDGGHLTIKGKEGTIKGGEYGIYAKNGTLTIKEGNYEAITSAIQVANATVNIEGGKFSVTSDKKNYVINCIDANYKDETAIVNITAGKFIAFDPANNAAEGAGTNFVADGYQSVNIGTADAPVYEVCMAVKVEAGETAELSADGTILEELVVKGTLDGKGHTLTVAAAPNTNHLINGSGNATVKNLTITGANQPSTVKDDEGEFCSTRALYFSGYDNIVVDNVTVSGVGYAFNTGTTNTNATITVSNSTLVGWSSFNPVKQATFKNVHFGVGTYFEGENNMWNGGIRPYSDVVFENCEFDKGFIIDAVHGSYTPSITLKNCKYDGTKITSGVNLALIETADLETANINVSE